MPRIHVQRPTGAVSIHKREYALLQQLGDGTGEFDCRELAGIEKYGDKQKMKDLEGDVPFAAFAEAFKKPPTKTEVQGEGNCVGWVATSATAPLKPWKFPRRAARPDDVVIQITFCGMCHSDLHLARGEWGNSMYPMVPGHEIIGVVTEVGANVTKFTVGEYAAVGFMADSCMDCTNCRRGEEHLCSNGEVISIFNSRGKDEQMNHGGYSSHIVCKDHFAVKIAREMHEAATAPLLCAGITIYEPMKVYGIDKPDMNVGVLGLGGLGHMAVKFSKAFGQKCTVLSRSYKKKELAMTHLGADNLVATSDADAVAGMHEKLDAIIDTVGSNHDLGQLLDMLKVCPQGFARMQVDGQLIIVGLPPAATPCAMQAWPLVSRRRSVRGSFIGGIPMTESMLEFCREKNIRADVEVVEMQDVHTAWERMLAGDVNFRFVIDTLSSIIAEEDFGNEA